MEFFIYLIEHYSFYKNKNTSDVIKELKYGDIICNLISEVRGYKSLNNLSLKTPVKTLEITCNNNILEAIENSKLDLCATLFINNLIINNCKSDYTINKIELEIQD